MPQTRSTRSSTHLGSTVHFVTGGVALLLACAAWLPAQALDDGGRAQSEYAPPSCIGAFTDVPCPSQFADWIEQLARDGVTLGCAAGMYCPAQPVLRQEMAAFLERTMRGTTSWPPHTVLVFHRQAAETDSDLSSGTELLNLVAAIPTTGTEMPSSTNPWLVKVGPGIYDLGSSSLTLPAYTALEGAGQDITVLTATGSSSVSHGTVVTGTHGKLSHVTVINTGDSTFATAIRIPTGAELVRLEHVVLEASNPTNASGAVSGVRSSSNTSFSMVGCDITAHGGRYDYGIIAYESTHQTRLDNVRVTVYGSSETGESEGFYGSGASPVITNSRFTVSDGANRYGIRAADGGAGPDVRNSVVEVTGGGMAVYIYEISGELHGNTLSASYGVWNQGTGSVVNISNCTITGTTRSIYNWSGCTVNVVSSTLAGSTQNGGTMSCFGNFTASAFLADTCP